MAANILVIDDDAIACEFLQEALKRAGHNVVFYTSARTALEQDLSIYDLLLSDIRMPDIDGIEFLRQVRQRWPELPVVLMTAYGSLDTTMDALRTGAWDYISKPFSPDDIRAMVDKVLTVRQFRKFGVGSEQRVSEESRLIGSSAVMVAFYKQLARVADSMASVLIEGESGTGKELTARALHQMSIRRDKPFVAVHCGAIPDTLLESELFGYEKGSFTGADHSHNGLLEAAQEGMIFLDEISEMSPSLQGKLLRFMQDREVRRIGGHQVRHVDVRVVAATNRQIDDEIQTGRFRADLLYRFVVRLHLPSLKEHKDDIPQLTESFLKKLGYPSVRISAGAMELLMAYHWPGNVRELENVLQQTLLLSPFTVILPEHLPERFNRRLEFPDPLMSPLEKAERDQILQALETHAWNQSRAAQMLGIDRKTLRTKIQRYDLLKKRPPQLDSPTSD
jgi:DNA-binding NtrC family response regulator